LKSRRSSPLDELKRRVSGTDAAVIDEGLLVAVKPERMD